MGEEERKQPSNIEWRVEDAEFKGFTKAQFRSVNDILEKVDKKMDNFVSKCDKNTNDISSIKAQAAIYSILFAAIISGIVAIGFKFLGS